MDNYKDDTNVVRNVDNSPTEFDPFRDINDREKVLNDLIDKPKWMQLFKDWVKAFEEEPFLEDDERIKDPHFRELVQRLEDLSAEYSSLENDASEDVETIGEKIGEKYYYNDKYTPRRTNTMIRFGPPPINPYDYETAQPYGFRTWLKQLLTSSEESSSSSEEYSRRPYRDLFDQEEAIGSYFSS